MIRRSDVDGTDLGQYTMMACFISGVERLILILHCWLVVIV